MGVLVLGAPDRGVLVLPVRHRQIRNVCWTWVPYSSVSIQWSDHEYDAEITKSQDERKGQPYKTANRSSEWNQGVISFVLIYR